jgi:hypothetical protein
MIPKIDSVQDELDYYMRDDRCVCWSCTRSKEFATIVNKLDSDEDKKWMIAFYNSVVEQEDASELEILYWKTRNATDP